MGQQKRGHQPWPTRPNAFIPYGVQPFPDMNGVFPPVGPPVGPPRHSPFSTPGFPQPNMFGAPHALVNNSPLANFNTNGAKVHISEVTPRSAEDVFSALATWDKLPSPENVESIYLIDLMALLHTPGPNTNLMDAKSARTLEGEVHEGGWYDRLDVLNQVIVEDKWNEALADIAIQVGNVPNSLLVVQTARVIEHTPIIKEALSKKGINAHLFAHTDYSQPLKSRKHQLIQRLWHFFSQASFVYYESPVSQRETRDLNTLFQRLATPNRPLPMLIDVHNPRSNIDPKAERKIIENVISENPNIQCSIHIDRWVWHILNYIDIVEALHSSGHMDNITDYIGRNMDYDSDVMPVLGDRGKKRELRATKLVIAGSKISVVFDNEHTLPVARLKQRVVDNIWPVDFTVRMSLDVLRSLVIKRLDDDPTITDTSMIEQHNTPGTNDVNISIPVITTETEQFMPVPEVADAEVNSDGDSDNEDHESSADSDSDSTSSSSEPSSSSSDDDEDESEFEPSDEEMSA